VRCDIPAHVYQATFEPRTQWSEEYAQGAEIRDYWQHVARKYDVYKYLKLRHKVVGAHWDGEAGKWTVSVEVEKGEKYAEEFDVLNYGNWTVQCMEAARISWYRRISSHLRHASIGTQALTQLERKWP